MDGLVPILDFQQIRYVAESWLALVEILSSTAPISQDNRREAIRLSLILYEMGQFTRELFISVILYKIIV